MSSTAHATTSGQGPWNHRTIAALKAHAAEKKLSASAIAAELARAFPECAGISRGAVLGKCNRTGLKLEANNRPAASSAGRTRKPRNLMPDGTPRLASPRIPRPARQASPRGTRTQKASSTAANAPGQNRPQGPQVTRNAIQQAAEQIEALHRRIVSGKVGQVHPWPDFPEGTEKFVKGTTPIPSRLVPSHLCCYETTRLGPMRTFACGAPVSKNSKTQYCHVHHFLCKLH